VVSGVFLGETIQQKIPFQVLKTMRNPDRLKRALKNDCCSAAAAQESEEVTQSKTTC
jgi:hypothetical protein